MDFTFSKQTKPAKRKYNKKPLSLSKRPNTKAQLQFRIASNSSEENEVSTLTTPDLLQEENLARVLILGEKQQEPVIPNNLEQKSIDDVDDDENTFAGLPIKIRKPNTRHKVWHKPDRSASAPGTREIPNGDSTCLLGFTFVITGRMKYFSRDEMEKFIVKHGGTIRKSLSKKTSYLLIGSEDLGESKKTKAMEKGINTITEDELLGKIETGIQKMSTLVIVQHTQ